MDLLKYQDALLLIIIPLMFVTAMQVKKSWKSLWDSNVTPKDRRILLQATLFLLEPIVVFLHELGHAVAIEMFGGKIAMFHYAVLSGFVVPSGDFTNAQILIIYLAGNLVQIAIGYLCFAVALVVRSPAVVAMLVYLGLWSVCSSAVLYAIMSIINLYGDWIAIYTSSEHTLVLLIGVCHCLVVASIFYMLKGKTPRLWFAKKTRPQWAAQYNQLEQTLETEPTHRNYLRLAWLCYEGALEDQAVENIDECLELEPNNLEPLMLKGWLAHDKLNLEQADKCFMEITKHDHAPPLLKARAYMAIAECQLGRSSRNANNRLSPEAAKREALEAFSAAQRADPNLADPHFHRAVLLNDLKRYAEAVEELHALVGLNWLDKSLTSRIPEQLQLALDQGPQTQ